MSAIVAYESGARPYAIGDNTAHRTYEPTTRPAASRLASALLRQGHNIDAGYAQINSSNFSTFGLDPDNVFDSCTNVAIGAQILRAAYRTCARTYGPGQLALIHALSIYNTGAPLRGLGYARAVFGIASQLHLSAMSFGRLRGPQRAVPFHRGGAAP